MVGRSRRDEISLNDRPLVELLNDSLRAWYDTENNGPGCASSVVEDASCLRRAATDQALALARANDPRIRSSLASGPYLRILAVRRDRIGPQARAPRRTTLSRLNDLLRQLRTENPTIADDLQREFAALADRRSFGLNFERHIPEVVELPGRKVRKGDKVRVLPARGEARTAENDRLWCVTGIATEDGVRRATLISLDAAEGDASVAVDDLVVIAEFRDPIYPGLVSTGKVERGDDKPFHTVINAENFHALQTLLFTHRGKVDCIYIDPPYNTGARG